MTSRITSRVWRALCWLLLLLIVGMGFAVWQRFAPSRLEPVYANHRLSYWLRGHPRDYTPVVQAVGTNALPSLLHPKVTLDTSGLSPLATELANRLGARLRTLPDETVERLLAVLASDQPE